MEETYYPDLPDGSAATLNVIRLQLQEDPGYLDAPECPYGPEERETLKKCLDLEAKEPVSGENRPENSEEKVSEEALEDRISALFKDLEDFGETLEGATPQEKAAYFRVAVSLTEKIVSLKERTTKVKDFKNLINSLLAFMDERMDADQRTEFMDYIKEYA